MDFITLWFSWASNFFPWWGWAIIILIAAGFTFQFWAPIWLALPLWAKVSIIFVVVLILTYLAGRNKGSKDERDMQANREAGATQLREKVDASIQKLDAVAVQKRLDRWRR